MATVDLITTAGRELEEQSNDLLNLVRVCSSICDHHPEWLDMFFPRIVDLDAKVQAYMMAVHQFRVEVTDGLSIPRTGDVAKR